SGRWANTAPAPRWSGRATGGSSPPRPLTLCYLLFLNGKAQIAAGAEAEQRILGRALQALADDPAVGLARLHSFEGEADEDAAITFLNLSFDDKSKIWSSLSVPYQLGVYFSVSPVLLSSTRSESFVRVRESEVTLSQREASAGRGGTP
uniref:Pvc16 family protein n=1 Tax=Anaerotruncus massiliensis (ex Liu et al. 2021) TaxID=2321404 RepID=UPI003AB29067